MFIKEFIYFPREKKSVIMIVAGLEHVQLIQTLFKTRKLEITQAEYLNIRGVICTMK